MQNKGAITALSIIFGLIFLYQLSFTVDTKVIESRAAKYAQGDADKEERYKDSVNRKQKENLKNASGVAKWFTWVSKDYVYENAKEKEINLGLDLKGGMTLTLEISAKELVEALAGENAQDPDFKKAIARAVEETKDGGDFVSAFVEEYGKINPKGSLATLFSYELQSRGINDKSSNEDVRKVLKKEYDDAFERSFQILSTRIDRFGVAQPVIRKLEGSGRILVELPGVKDQERVESLLQKTAQLEFWETYSFEDIHSSVDDLNALIANANVQKEVKSETIQDDQTSIDSTNQGGLSDLIDNDTDNGNQNDGGKQARKLYFDLLIPSYSADGRPAKTACVGRALASDKAIIDTMLNFGIKNNIFPRDLKFAWSAKPETFDGNEYFELIALKSSPKSALNKKSSNGCVLSGEVITNARQDYGQYNDVKVDIEMNRDGSNEWRRITGSNIGKQIAIVLDDLVYSYPVVNQEISGGRSQISGGGMTVEEGQDLANILKAGKLPARVNVLGHELVGPSLGKESVRKGVWSMIFAFILVLVYMVFFYKKSGMVANIALIVNVFFLFGVLACLGSVLTLPGIAGIVLTLGMAVDSNVIIFERIKEELRGGKGLRPAIDAGYKNAYSAIIDGNVTTLITGIVLIVLGAGPVHSFAVTLCIGIITSLFTSIFISRLIFTRMLDKEKNISFTTKFTENFLKDKNFDFIKFRKTAYIIAIVMIVISVGSLCIRGLNRGIDFTGGRNYVIQFDDPSINVERVRDVLSDVKIDKASIHDALGMKEGDNVEEWSTPEVKTYGTKGQLKITTKFLIDDGKHSNHVEDSIIQVILYDNLKGLYKSDMSMKMFSSEDENVGILSTQKVGGTIARDVTRKSIWAIVVSLVLMFGYIAIRFRKWQYGLSALAALTHDTIIMLGMYSLFYNFLPFTMEVDQAFIAAVLTIIGYSINATVVIFDRVRENTNLHPKATWRENINNAVNSTLTRSFNTSGSTFIVLLAIFIFGGDTIRGFIFALLVGILAGTFSSVFLSSPIAYNLIGGQKQENALAEANEKDKNKKKK